MYCLTDSIIIDLSSDCTATTYRSYFFVQKAPNIYDNAESVNGGYLLDKDTVRRADTKQSTVHNRYMCVNGLDYSHSKNSGGITVRKHGHLHTICIGRYYAEPRSL